MRLKGSAAILEDRRRRALALVDKGLSFNEAARKIGCAASSVMRWWHSRRQRGSKGLKVRSSPGRPPKLTHAQRQRLLRLLLRGAMAHGYSTDLWTTQRIADVIRKTFRVTYHRDHIGRLMRGLGWSPQKPERRSLERDERKIGRWKRKEWPRVKKTPSGWVPTSSSSMNPASS